MLLLFSTPKRFWMAETAATEAAAAAATAERKARRARRTTDEKQEIVDASVTRQDGCLAVGDHDGGHSSWSTCLHFTTVRRMGLCALSGCRRRPLALLPTLGASAKPVANRRGSRKGPVHNTLRESAAIHHSARPRLAAPNHGPFRRHRSFFPVCVRSIGVRIFPPDDECQPSIRCRVDFTGLA